MEAAAPRGRSAGVRGRASRWSRLCETRTAARRRLIRRQRSRLVSGLGENTLIPHRLYCHQTQLLTMDCKWFNLSARCGAEIFASTRWRRQRGREGEGWNDRKERSRLANRQPAAAQPLDRAFKHRDCECVRSRVFFSTCVSWQLNENQSASTSAILSVGERRWAFPVTLRWLAADQLRYFYLFFLLLSYLNYIFSIPLLFFPFFTIHMPSLDELGVFSLLCWRLRVSVTAAVFGLWKQQSGL